MEYYAGEYLTYNELHLVRVGDLILMELTSLFERSNTASMGIIKSFLIVTMANNGF